MNDTELNEAIRGIKQQFFAYRNGILAEQLRAAGSPCHVIFGLNVPQIAAIARQLTPSAELAEALWADKNVRESRLLACYLFPRDTDAARAEQLMLEVQTPEEGDMLCFRLLKHLPEARQLAGKFAAGRDALTAYTARSLTRHLE